uniref:CD80-like immunoglobulin C2-set domain-containing protein n=1 Tax=Rhodnius prolixus TaxID=13249 RepID=T1HWC5_RHOPR
MDNNSYLKPKFMKVYQSNSTVVTLNNVKKEMTGTYKCEVSADAPLFHTEIKSSHVLVIAKPITLPEIQVEKTKYSVGEKIRANCTSRSSYPAANLTFYANGVPDFNLCFHFLNI